MASDMRSAGSSAGLARWAVATAVLVAGLFFACLASFAFGTYYLTDTGIDRLREQAPALVMAGVAGTGAVAAFRALLDMRVLSAWLLVGLLPTAVGALNHLGFIG